MYYKYSKAKIHISFEVKHFLFLYVYLKVITNTTSTKINDCFLKCTVGPSSWILTFHRWSSRVWNSSKRLVLGTEIQGTGVNSLACFASAAAYPPPLTRRQLSSRNWGQEQDGHLLKAWLEKELLCRSRQFSLEQSKRARQTRELRSRDGLKSKSQEFVSDKGKGKNLWATPAKEDMIGINSKDLWEWI